MLCQSGCCSSIGVAATTASLTTPAPPLPSRRLLTQRVAGMASCPRCWCGGTVEPSLAPMPCPHAELGDRARPELSPRDRAEPDRTEWRSVGVNWELRRAEPPRASPSSSRTKPKWRREIPAKEGSPATRYARAMANRPNSEASAWHERTSSIRSVGVEAALR